MYAIAYILSRGKVRYRVTFFPMSHSMIVDRVSATAYSLRVSLILRVRELREALGLTQAELAERAGIRRATVNRIENAHVTAIDLEVLEKLGDALRVEPGFLIVRASGEEGSDPTPSKRQRSRR
jgi:DNA-binding Xre family transcriptional regulator